MQDPNPQSKVDSIPDHEDSYALVEFWKESESEGQKKHWQCY